MRIQLSNGMIVEGTVEQVRATVKALNLPDNITKGYYFSSSKNQWIRIENMEDRHLVNAIKRIYRNFVADIDNTSTMAELSTCLVEFHLSKELLNNLENELNKRLSNVKSFSVKDFLAEF